MRGKRRRTEFPRRRVSALHSLMPMWSNFPSFLRMTRFLMASSTGRLRSTRADWKRSIFFVPRKAAMQLSTLLRRPSSLQGKQ